ncbi:MAG: PAS domain S-box protein [Gammaproteobacteria bacterium]
MNQQDIKQVAHKSEDSSNSSERLRAIIDTAVEGIITIDSNGIIQSFNPAAEKIFAYKENEVVGNSINLLMPLSFQQQHDDSLKSYLNGGKASIIGIGRELCGVRKDGTEFPMLLSVSEFLEGDKIFFTGFVYDLSSEKNYLKKAASLEHILENSVNEIYIFDANTLQFIHANKGALKNIQYSNSEILSLTPVDIKPEFSLEKFQKLIEPLSTGEEDKIVFTTEHQRKDEGRYPVEVHLELSEYGGKPAYIAIILDITRRKHIEESLRLKEEEFQLIFENAPIGIAVLDLEGNYVNVNPSLCDILGYSKPELLKFSYKDITHPDDIVISGNFLHKLLKGDFSGFSIEKRYIRKDRKVINVALSVALVHESVFLAHNKMGKPALLISHIQDVTEEAMAEEKSKALQEQLAHLDRIGMMGEMAAGIAHEINQPLTAIDSYAQAALRRIKDKSLNLNKIQELLEKISKASARTSDVISHMRAMVKRKSNQHERCNINILIEEAVKLAEADSQAKEFKLKQDLAKSFSDAIVDPIQIQQVILNLIRNAMDAAAQETEEYKQIIIRSALIAKENRIQVSIIDFGSGIDDETAEQLFNPFFTTKPSGMGMGLAICQSIIQMHGGHLWFTSNENKGSAFHFTLPTALNENE